jgi:lipoprotein-anchoring transpeptidase ErfK/SrfK
MSIAGNATLAMAAAVMVAGSAWLTTAHQAPAPLAEPLLTATSAPSSGASSDDEVGRIAVSTPTADSGARAIRSVLDVRKAMTFGDYAWNDKDVPQGPVWIRVDLARQLISVFRDGHEIGAAVILFGGNGKPTPTGDFPILQKAADYQSKTYDAPMPYMLRLTADGVAIHASNVREGWATHGCIGVPMEFARRLFGEAALGDTVTVIGAPNQAKPAQAS